MKKTNFRWIICSLLFFATTVNYLDRQVLSLTYKDFIAPVFGWSDNDYGTITAVFSIIYALCNLFAGKFIDWLVEVEAARPGVRQRDLGERQVSTLVTEATMGRDGTNQGAIYIKY